MIEDFPFITKPQNFRIINGCSFSDKICPRTSRAKPYPIRLNIIIIRYILYSEGTFHSDITAAKIKSSGMGT